jgi:RNA polymerase sigma factor (sigma-70 family)
VREIEIDDESDAELWLAYREGDTAAFTRLYRSHAPAVLRYSWSIVGERALAEETLQETFLTAWDKRKASHIVDDSLLPWLLTIARNHSRNQLRRARRHRTVPVDAELAAEAPRDELAWVSAEIASLSESDQLLCQLCLVEGYTYAEAARVLDTTEAAVGKRLQRVRARLARIQN